MTDLAHLRAALGPGAGSSDYDLSPEVVLPENRKLRPAAVLIGVSESDNGLRLWLTKRASHLKHHPGQIAFPGGQVDSSDASVVDTALREAREEIGLPGAEILGQLPPHEAVTAFSVTPVVALMKPFNPIPEKGEVAEVFTVPFSHVANSENYIIERRRWRGTWRQFYTVPYGPYYIWGATARMLRLITERL